MTKQPWLVIALAFTYVFGSAAQAQRSVSASPFSELAFARTLQFPARVVSLHIAEIATETSGRIVDFPVQVGDQVKVGQRLIEIDCESPRINEKRILAGLKRLRAARELTLQQLERARKLVQSNSISREELDQRQTQLNADEASIEEQLAQLDSAKLDIQRCQVKAPFAGTVVHKSGHAGSFATPGAPQLSLLKQHEVEVELDLPTSQLGALQAASDIRFIVDDKPFTISVRSVLPQVDAQTLQQKVRLAFQQDQRPPGGSFGQVAFSTARHYVAAELLQKRDGRFGLFVVEDGKARFINLPGVEEGQSAVAQLAPDRLIITSDLKLLEDQEPIRLEP